tara:strand:+ start:818 stop:1612 length:795 start_codon:yes stop_codon:yes gene_type:complete
MKKNAVLLAGFMRDYNKTVQEYHNNIINNNSNIDLFIVTWDKVGIKLNEEKKIKLTNTDEKIIVKTKDCNDDKINGNDVKNKYNPISMKIFDLDLFEESIISYAKLAEYSNLIKTEIINGKRQNYLTLMRRYSCFFVLKQGIKLIEDYSKKNNIKYDKILKIRADFEKDGYYPKIDWNLKIDKKLIFLSNWNIQDFSKDKKNNLDKFSDHLAYGNFDDMKIYLSIFENLYKIEDKFEIINKRWHQEYCLAIWLKMNKINYKPLK